MTFIQFLAIWKVKWWKLLKLVPLWRSETEVPFLSELQFCSKVEADENQENLREGTPQPILKFRPDLVQYLDATRSESVSPGRFAASRSRYLIKYLFKFFVWCLIQQLQQLDFTLYFSGFTNTKQVRSNLTYFGIWTVMWVLMRDWFTRLNFNGFGSYCVNINLVPIRFYLLFTWLCQWSHFDNQHLMKTKNTCF